MSPIFQEDDGGAGGNIQLRDHGLRAPGGQGEDGDEPGGAGAAGPGVGGDQDLPGLQQPPLRLHREEARTFNLIFLIVIIDEH